MNKRIESKFVNATNLLIVLNGGLIKLPHLKDDNLYCSTREVASVLDVTVQRVGQYANDEGLPKAGRDRFYYLDVVNWAKVKMFAEKLNKRPQDMGEYGYVDFTLGVDSPLVLKEKHLLRALNKGK